MSNNSFNCAWGGAKVKISLYTQVAIWVDTIPKKNHIDIKAILPRYGGSYMVYRPEWYWKQKHCQILICYWYQKKNEILIVDTQIISKKRTTIHTGAKDGIQDFTPSSSSFSFGLRPLSISLKLTWKEQDCQNLQCLWLPRPMRELQHYQFLWTPSVDTQGRLHHLKRVLHQCVHNPLQVVGH